MENYQVKLHQKIDITKDFDPDDYGDWKGKKEKGQEKLIELQQELESLQQVLYAEHKHKILIIIQAMDTAGKDGTIRSVFAGINPQGVHVASFKVPTEIENDHDFLWRVHPKVPGKGELVIFNRSHYEQVLVVRVHKIEPEKVWRRHYKQINDFERLLTETGTTVIKFFLNIDLEEQKKRLLERIDIPEKQWKFNVADIKERGLWPQYMKAYSEAISVTSTKEAPWHIIPANHNWYRNLMVATIIVEKLKSLEMQYPQTTANLKECRAQLEAEGTISDKK
ncbi:MAG: polyphosphate kinase [Chloroflexi bacterium HGW-Chloroflexi-5]|jgi:PPK2 family polyphosphate:nucleotide phosphotransferase|nr:MAG: polyphosphate kinase [Chloroflexi bacterium HGW-Chloroflexi-5]